MLLTIAVYSYFGMGGQQEEGVGKPHRYTERERERENGCWDFESWLHVHKG